ncbi:MAG: hypothetical protein HWN66_03780 [Candidatus Helarchaeota archaeon]|nr:hypothetical protein [Candidatus Helarchaeota archaeon]
MKLEIPERKSHKLERAILKFNKDLNELQTNHKKNAEKILDLSSRLLKSNHEEIEIAKALEDLEYEMDNNILLNMEIVFETIGGFEIDLVDIESYLPCIKDEQELLRDLKLSAKNLVKTISVTDKSLNKQERDNFNFLQNSYKKLAKKTQQNLKEIYEILNKQFQKVKKMENI